VVKARRSTAILNVHKRKKNGRQKAAGRRTQTGYWLSLQQQQALSWLQMVLLYQVQHFTPIIVSQHETHICGITLVTLTVNLQQANVEVKTYLSYQLSP